MAKNSDTSGSGGQKTALMDNNKPRIPFFHFGFGFYWAWLWILAVSAVPTMLPASRTSTELFMIFIISSITSAAVMLAGALFSEKLSRPAGQRALLVTACAFGLLGTALMALLRGDAGVNWSLYLVSITLGISRAGFNLLWCRLYSALGIKQASLCMSGSIAIGALLYLLITNMQPVLVLISILLLPLAATGSFVAAERKHQEKPEAHLPSMPEAQLPAMEESHIQDLPGSQAMPEANIQAGSESRLPAEQSSVFPFPIFWRLFFGIGIYAVAFAFISNTLFVPDNDEISFIFLITLLGIAAVGLAISFIIIIVPRRLNLVLIYRLVLPLMAVGFLLIPLLGAEKGNLAVIFVMVGFTVFDILTWLVLANISSRLSLSPYKVFGFGRGVHFTGLFIGAMIALFIATPPELFQELFTPVSLLMVFTLIIASTLVLTENELLGKGFHSFARPTSKDQDEEDLTTTLKRAKWRERCKAIAQEYNLSPREEEVLLLLAKGRDTVFIQSELGISNHTARSHVYHIYQKLNVHSRQELLNFIENAKDGEVL